MKTIYIIDACALIDAAKEYNMSKKTFLPIWEALSNLIENKELFTSSEIFDEIKDDDLLTWAKQHKDFFCATHPRYTKIRCRCFKEISNPY